MRKRRTASRAAPGSRLQKFIDFRFVKAGEFVFAFDEHRTLEQVGVFEHELDRLVFRRRFLLHVLFFVERRAGTQEQLNRIVADDFA